MEKGRIFRIICGFMIGVIVFILIEMFVSDDDNTLSVDIDMTVPYSDSASWMGYLSDETYLSELSIPGTNNSCSRYVFWGFGNRCQDTDVSQQLKDGFRYLDLDVALDSSSEGDTVKMVNGAVDCHTDGNLFSDSLHLTDVTADMYKFLQEHPEETVIVNLSIEDEANASKVQDLIDSEIKSNKDYWYTGQEIPTLGEVRGKIVLARGYKDNGSLEGLEMIWDKQDNKAPVDIPYDLYVNDEFRLWVQDRYNYSVEDKYEALVDGFENCEADENTFFINFASTTGNGVFAHPRGYANNINELLLEYKFKAGTSYGIINVDFGDENIARKIYYSNSF